MVHKKLTEEFKKHITKALGEYPLDDLKVAADHYEKMFHDTEYTFCEYKWGIHEFLSREDPDF